MSSKVFGLALLAILAIAMGPVAVHGLPQSLNNVQYNPDEEKAAAFLADAEEELRSITFIEWNYVSNITDETEKAKLESQVNNFAQLR